MGLVDIITTFWRPLFVIRNHTYTTKWNLFVSYNVSISGIPHKIRNVLKNLCCDDLRTQHLAAHYVIRVFVLFNAS